MTPDQSSSANLWLLFALLTVVTWGLYGILLHSGQTAMGDPANGRYKAFLWVGIAYVVIAVVGPLAMLLANGADWDMPGMRHAVHRNGTINDDSDVDAGWTVEVAFPWQSLKWLADGRCLPGREGDVWRMDLSRFQWFTGAGGSRVCPGWAFNTHGVYDSHIPDRFTYIHLSETEVGVQ